MPLRKLPPGHVGQRTHRINAAHEDLEAEDNQRRKDEPDGQGNQGPAQSEGDGSLHVKGTAHTPQPLSEALSIWARSWSRVGPVACVTKKAATALAITRRFLSGRFPSDAHR